MRKKQNKPARRLLAGTGWTLVAMPLFFGILTYIITVPLIDLDIAFSAYTDVCIVGLQQAASVIMSAMAMVLPLVLSMLMCSKYTKMRGMVSSIEVAIMSLVFVLVFLLPFMASYALAGRSFGVGWYAGEVLYLYVLSLIGCFIGNKVARVR